MPCVVQRPVSGRPALLVPTPYACEDVRRNAVVAIRRHGGGSQRLDHGLPVGDIRILEA